ncbi:hypothetical protein BABINDRAFT_160445 [Babjeviella inositovora NRRL Y-12698]|uniref:Uncharacterized protein n=1 Tax=Babjeviella inositovora NRRL Y-12698 TaxID=984486 RepID=A0A1E3QTK8_9ASCO|nr:uncharacterized protein BABINDRAFT_160445 [Babjeviella inositovora NRRL Y-12698]ODQ81025.1 hypothetical protein BABINDRAFT_160445 [Babjeviella inositovora NRRL Y-12698]
MNIHRCRFVDYTPHTITSLAFSHKSSSAQFTPTNLRLAVGRANGGIEIWNGRQNWYHETTLQGGRGRSIEGVVWSLWNKDSPRLFSIGGSTVITEWNLKTGKPLANFDCNTGVIWSIAASENGEKLVVGCDDGSVVLVDISGGPGSVEFEGILQRQDSRVLSIAWIGNERVVGGCADGRIRVWSCAGDDKYRLVSTMRVDKSKAESTLVWSVLVLPHQNQLVSGDSTGSVKFWDLEHFAMQQSFSVHDADVLCLTADFSGEKVFSAGIDRKIFNFNLLADKKAARWVNTSNRLLHANDVRTMASFESKNANFLVSGGVERSIVINSMTDFQDGPYRKLPPTPQTSPVGVNELERLVYMWQDQEVSIWKVQGDELEGSHRLVAKLNLADEENITSVASSVDGKLLAVARLTGIKVFQIELKKQKMKITKIRNVPALDAVGARNLLFTDSQLVFTSPEDELYTIDVAENGFDNESIREIEFADQPAYKLAHLAQIRTLKYANGKLSVTRLNGSIEIVDVASGTVQQLTKLAVPPVAAEFTANGTLLVLTAENKLYEFELAAKGDNLLTKWSRNNTEYLPAQFTLLEDKPVGMFMDNKRSSRVWVYGASWLAFFDLSQDVPFAKNAGKKRARGGLCIEDGDSHSVEDEDEEAIDEMEIMKTVRQSAADRLKRKQSSTEMEEGSRAFWMTEKYKPLLFVGAFGEGEIVVIERPVFHLPTPPAFNLHQIKV